MNLPWPFNEIWNWIKTVWDGIMAELDKVWRDIGSRFDSLWNAVHSWIRDWTGIRINDLWNWVAGRLDWVRSKLEGWIRWAGNRVDDVWGWLQSSAQWVVDNVLNPLWGGFQWVLNSIGDRLGDVGQWIGDRLGDVGQWLGDRLGDLGTTLDNMGQRMGLLGDEIWRTQLQVADIDRKRDTEHTITINTITQGGGAVASLIQAFVLERLINPLEDWLAKVPGDIARIFTDLFTNLWTTMQSWIGAAMEWWGNTAWPALENSLAGLRDFVNDQALGFADNLLGAVTGGSPATPETAMPRVRNLFAIGATAVGGLAAMSVAAELMHPLKQIGLGRISAMIWDATGYRTIIASVMGILVGANIGTPLRYWANRQFRPWIPGRSELLELRRNKRIGKDEFWEFMTYHGYGDHLQPLFETLTHTVPQTQVLEMMYAKKEISEAQFDQWMSLWGIGPEYLDVYHRHIWLDPRLTELVRIAQFYRPPETPDPRAVEWLARAGIPLEDPADWWFTYKIAKAGYESIDIPVLVAVARIAVARREQTLYFDAARRLRRDGYIGDARLIELVEDGWRPRPPIQFRRDATDLDVEYDVKAEVASTVLSAFGRRAIGEGTCIAMLNRIGMVPQRISLLVLRQKLGLVPRQRLVLAAEVEDAIA